MRGQGDELIQFIVFVVIAIVFALVQAAKAAAQKAAQRRREMTQRGPRSGDHHEHEAAAHHREIERRRLEALRERQVAGPPAAAPGRETPLGDLARRMLQDLGYGPEPAARTRPEAPRAPAHHAPAPPPRPHESAASARRDASAEASRPAKRQERRARQGSEPAARPEGPRARVSASRVSRIAVQSKPSRISTMLARDGATLRRAMILRELLSPPAGWRAPDER